MLVAGAFLALHLAYWLFPQKIHISDFRITDYLLRLRASSIQPPHLDRQEVVHVDAIFYTDRSDLAHVIRNLAQLGVSSQLVDVVLAEKIGEEEDRPLLEATLSAGNVYYGLSFGSESEHRTIGRESSHIDTVRYMDQTKWPVILKGNPGGFVVGADPQITYPSLATASRGLGFINLKPDLDGILRRVPLLVRYRGAFFPSLAFRAVCDRLKVSPENILVQPGKSITLRLPDDLAARAIVIPIDENGNMLIDLSQSGSHPQLRLQRIPSNCDKNMEKLEALKGELSGKIAMLIGNRGQSVRRPIGSHPAPVVFRCDSNVGDAEYPVGVFSQAAFRNRHADDRTADAGAAAVYGTAMVVPAAVRSGPRH